MADVSNWEVRQAGRVKTSPKSVLRSHKHRAHLFFKVTLNMMMTSLVADCPCTHC